MNLSWDGLWIDLQVILYLFLLGALVSGATGHWQVAQGFIIAIAVSVAPGMNWIYIFRNNTQEELFNGAIQSEGE